MTTLWSDRPTTEEYVEYYERYISLVPETDIVQASSAQLNETLAFLRAIPPEKADYRYAPGKWSVKEVIGHLLDSERVFAYRALNFARGNTAPLPGYEQEEYVIAGEFDAYDMTDLISEYEQTRCGNLGFLRHLPATAWSRTGVASERSFTVRALAFVMVGHERYHLEVLRTRYL